MAKSALVLHLLILTSLAREAETIFGTLKKALLPVRGSYTQHPEKLGTAPRCDLIIACLGEALTAAAIVEYYRKLEREVPLLAIADTAQDAAALLSLMRAGASALIAPGDETALVRAVRREWKSLKLAFQNDELRNRLRVVESQLKELREHSSSQPRPRTAEAPRPVIGEAYRALLGIPEGQAPPGRELLDWLAPEYREGVKALLAGETPAPDSAARAAPGPATAVESVPVGADGTPLVVIETPAAPEPDPGEAALIEQIERALANDGFKLVYQPIVSLRGDSQEPYSVLLRLLDEHNSFRVAEDLLEPAQRSGRLPEVDRWVIRHALIQLNARRQAGHRAHFFLSLSAASLANEQLLIWLCDTLREHNVRGPWVSFQLQEADARAQTDAAARLAAGLRQIKSRMVISHFGSYPDSELLFEALAVDFVKLAPKLAFDLGTDGFKQERVRTLIGSARQHGVKSIVSCIEDELSLAFAWNAGADYVQGNFLARPSPIFVLGT